MLRSKFTLVFHHGLIEKQVRYLITTRSLSKKTYIEAFPKEILAPGQGRLNGVFIRTQPMHHKRMWPSSISKYGIVHIKKHSQLTLAQSIMEISYCRVTTLFMHNSRISNMVTT